MQHNHICIIDTAKLYSGKIGKKTNETDYMIYNLKENDQVLCLYEPHRYPDKIQSLLGAISSGDHIIWVIDSMDAEFAEIALALWLTDKPGTMIITDNIGIADLEPILKNSSMWNWEKLDQLEPNELRQKLTELKFISKDSPKIALVDACFSVGGVGTVALTKIESGIFKVHDELISLPGGAKTAIRSIQEQDQDTKETSLGSRAGFSLKNIQPDKVKRGGYLAEPGVLRQFNSGKIICQLSALIKEPIEPETDIFLAWGLQYLTCRLDNKEPFSARDGQKEFGFRLQLDAAAKESQKVLLVRANKRPRIVGKGELNLQ